MAGWANLAMKCPPKVTSFLVIFVAIWDLYIIAYDPSMINNLNVVVPYLEYFKLDAKFIGLNVAIVAAGSVVSGPFVGILMDRFGRKGGIMIGAAVRLVGAIMQIAAPNEACLLVARFLLGFSFTIAGTATPTWVMELAPPKTRGLRIGIVMSSLPVAAFIVCGFVIGTYQFQSDWAWRSVMLGEVLGPAIVLLMMPTMPESPRWLISRERKEEAMIVLAHLQGDGSATHSVVTTEFDQICAGIELENQSEVSWKGLVSPPPNRRRFLIALATNIIFQINGSNTVLYFLTVILANAQIIDTGEVLYINLGITAFDVLSVWAGAYLIEKIGRKKMLVWCSSAMVLSLTLMATLLSQSEAQGNVKFSYGAIGVMGIFLFGSCASWQILNYSYPQEVLKYSQRGKGTAVAQSVGYAFSFLSLYTFPIALAAMSWRFYAVNAAWNLVTVVIMQLWFVETRGKSLEEINDVFEPLTVTEAEERSEQESLSIDEVGNMTIGAKGKTSTEKR